MANITRTQILSYTVICIGVCFFSLTNAIRFNIKLNIRIE